MMPAQLRQLLAQHGAQPAADAGVDLVEDEGRDAIDSASTVLTASVSRESSPPEAMRAGRGPPRGWGRRRSRRGRRPRRAGPGRGRIVAEGLGLDLDREPGLAEAEGLELRLDGPGERFAGFPPCLGELGRSGP